MNIVIEEIVSEFPILITEEVFEIVVHDVASYFDLTEVNDTDFVGKDGFVPTVDEANGKIVLQAPTGGGGGGTTNLSLIANPTNNVVSNSNGNGFTIPLAGVVNAGLMTATEKTKIATAVQPTDITGFATTTYVDQQDNLKVDKVIGKSLVDDAEIIKLLGVESGAEVNNISDANATDLTDGGETALHIHDSRYYTETETDLLLNDKFDNPIGDGTQYLDGAGVPTTFPTIPSITGLVPYVGATNDVDLGENQIKVGQIELDQTPTGIFGVGKIRWNDTEGTAEIRLKGNNVTLQIGQELVKRVVNKTATNITLLEANYQVVKITGATGQRLSVDLAQANTGLSTATTLGVVTETIANNQEGFITYSGEVNGINTSGSLQGETWADGDVLYLSPTIAGGITNIKPTAPNHSVIVGYVEYAHNVNGKIFVKIDNGYELEDLHNVSSTSYNSVIDTDSLLVRDTTNSIWKRFTFDNLKTWLDTYFSATKIRSILGITTLSGSNTGDNATNTTSNAYADAKVTDAIIDGVTTVAPSQNAVFDALANKQDTLVSSTNIKTINGSSVLGSGDLVVSGGISDAPNDLNAYVRSALSWVVGYTKSAIDTLLGNKVDKTSWIDYSATSTIVGWSSFTQKEIFYKIIGDTIFVIFLINGTSNSTFVTFTLPNNILNTNLSESTGYVVNNSTESVNAGRITGGNNTNLITIFRQMLGLSNSWTASGIKVVSGQFYAKIQ